jgi:2-oxoglutarate dehydrogenase E2 component (dihydrolipoamide succinyltransferase)
MAIELRVPTVGESVTEVFIGEWRKAEGAGAASGDNLVEIESDKATLEIPAPAAGVLTKILKKKGETAAVGEVIGYFEPGATAGNGEGPKSEAPKSEAKAESPKTELKPAPVGGPGDGARVMPAAQRELADRGLQAQQVAPSGPGGRLLKEDVVRHAETPRQPASAGTAVAPQKPAAQPPRPVAPIPVGLSGSASRQEEAVPMSPIRRRIAQRLVEAQQNAALLTTFNEVDMSNVMALRSEHKDMFQQKHGFKLGFMSFFVKATIDALKMVPQVNAEIRGNDIIYHNYYDIGIAVSGGKGLVVPVLRNAERMSFAEVEGSIEHFGKLARENKLTLEQLTGGTFTISNGGVFGSLLSTPIVNPPQSGILGLHAIQERPIAKDGQVVIRPMMYMAFTYDHRIIDGREAVTFLRRIKETIENPSRMLLEI